MDWKVISTRWRDGGTGSLNKFSGSGESKNRDLSGVGRVELQSPDCLFLAGRWKHRESTRKKASCSLFMNLFFFLLEKTLRSFLLVDGPDLFDGFHVNNHEMAKASNCRAVSHSLIASSSVPTSAGHHSIYKQDHDSPCLDSVNIQRKNTETKHGRV